MISESDGEANPYYFFNSIIIPGEWRGTQAFHFLEPTSWKSAMNLDTVAAARELNWENGAGPDPHPAHLKHSRRELSSRAGPLNLLGNDSIMVRPH